MNIENLTKDTQLPLKNYHDCIQAIVCNDSHDRCYLGDCLDCPNTSILRKHLLKCFDENDIFQIEYQIALSLELKYKHKESKFLQITM